MRILKSNSLLKLANGYIIDSSQPCNISYAWNFGSLLLVCLIIQIVTGVTLAMHYNPSVLEAFNSVEHIMRDVNNGWLVRYLHSNTASAFFFLVYLHVGRGMYYGSYRSPRVLTWVIGTVILVLMMAIGFLGYVLPYGQMSLWGMKNYYSTGVTSKKESEKPDKKFMSMFNKTSSITLNPWYVTGFSDAESSFQISITKRSANNLGWNIRARFDIYLDKKDLPLLLLIQQFFGGVGSIVIDEKRNKASFNVNKLSDFTEHLIPHFERYPLQSTKLINYNIWKAIVTLMINKEHLSHDGLIKIVSLKAGLNNGLTPILKENFPNVNPTEVQANDDYLNLPLDPNWITGFSDGDSSFYVSESANSNQFQAYYKINLNEKELTLLKRIQDFFEGLGLISNHAAGHASYFRVANRSNLVSAIIPHFDNYPLVGNKLLHFNLWKEIVNILNTGEHLTPKGAARIRELKTKLNK